MIFACINSCIYDNFHGAIFEKLFCCKTHRYIFCSYENQCFTDYLSWMSWSWKVCFRYFDTYSWLWNHVKIVMKSIVIINFHDMHNEIIHLNIASSGRSWNEKEFSLKPAMTNHCAGNDLLKFSEKHDRFALEVPISCVFYFLQEARNLEPFLAQEMQEIP